MTKYFIIGASKDHVLKGVEDSFAQAGHGRKDLLDQISKGDWIVYYSAKEALNGGKLIQKFTAIGQITDEAPYQVQVSPEFKPYRRKTKFQESRGADIRPLLPQLHFIENKKKWGFYLMSGFREISQEDFELIQAAMQ